MNRRLVSCHYIVVRTIVAIYIVVLTIVVLAADCIKYLLR